MATHPVCVRQPRPSRARPTLRMDTPQLLRQLAGLLRRRGDVALAAEAAGVSRGRVWAWLRAGQAGHARYRRLARALYAGTHCPHCDKPLRARRPTVGRNAELLEKH